MSALMGETYISSTPSRDFMEILYTPTITTTSGLKVPLPQNPLLPNEAAADWCISEPVRLHATSLARAPAGVARGFGTGRSRVGAPRGAPVAGEGGRVVFSPSTCVCVVGYVCV